MSDSQEKTKHEHVYYMKGVPIHAYLSETGEFQWVPASQACSDKVNAKSILEVLQKMPEDRRAVWASRLDTEQTKMTCPVIGSEADLCKEFDEFCAAYDKNRRKPKQIAQQPEGGESTK